MEKEKCLTKSTLSSQLSICLAISAFHLFALPVNTWPSWLKVPLISVSFTLDLQALTNRSWATLGNTVHLRTQREGPCGGNYRERLLLRTSHILCCFVK